MTKVTELFTIPTKEADVDWFATTQKQHCSFLNRRCLKTRKSDSDISIGTCSVIHGRAERPVIICPHRLLERRQIFVDSIHLLTKHEPGNELHIIPEVSVPGGNIDYFLVSTKRREIQTLDTTGTVWPARQKFLASKGIAVSQKDLDSKKSFGMNWKMTAKTILVQMHHKIQTLESLNKHLVLSVQEDLLAYFESNFNFAHLSEARLGDSMHFHAYSFAEDESGSYRIELTKRKSTDTEGIAVCLGLQADPKVELEHIVKQLTSKISASTLFTLSL